MPSSNDPRAHTAPPEAVALLEKIEELSLLRALSDRLAAATDFGVACQALTDLVWAERGAESVAYVTVDPYGQSVRLEAVTPAQELGVLLDGTRAYELLAEVIAEGRADVVRCPSFAWGLGVVGGTVLWAPTVLRGELTGGLLIHTRGTDEHVTADCRLLAIVVAMAALGLNAARTQVREDFLATLRHDIKNPLGVALGYLDMVEDRLVDGALEPSELRRCLQASTESLKAVDDLVVNYLHLAVIDRGRPAIDKEEVDLGAVASAVVSRLLPAATEKGLVLTLSGTTVPVSADRRQVTRVIGNLIDNAIKYTPAPGRVEMTLDLDGREAVFAVRDTGLGLTAADLTRLFQKNTRFHLEARIPGTGLGLYLSKAIVEAHGGRIDVQSAAGEGSTFTLRLPAVIGITPELAADPTPEFEPTNSLAS